MEYIKLINMIKQPKYVGKVLLLCYPYIPIVNYKIITLLSKGRICSSAISNYDGEWLLCVLSVVSIFVTWAKFKAKYRQGLIKCYEPNLYIFFKFIFEFIFFVNLFYVTVISGFLIQFKKLHFWADKSGSLFAPNPNQAK